jgi:hypothetical protein
MTGVGVQSDADEAVTCPFTGQTYDPDRTGWPLQRVNVESMPSEDDGEVTNALYPAPWVNGHNAFKNDFYSFRDDSHRAFTDRLCCICGDPLNAVVAIAAMSGKRETNGGWGHPRCTQLTVRTCPHFTRQNFETVAWLYEGPGVGCTEGTMSIDDVDMDVAPLTPDALRELARRDPLGLGTSCPIGATA